MLECNSGHIYSFDLSIIPQKLFPCRVNLHFQLFLVLLHHPDVINYLQRMVPGDMFSTINPHPV